MKTKYVSDTELAELRALAAGSQDIVGVVESIDDESITGWVLSRSGQNLRLALRVSDQTLPAEVSWELRPEICAAFGLSDWVTGFSIPLSRHLAQRIRKAVSAGETVGVVAAGVLLPCAESAIPKREVSEALTIEEVAHFSIVGLFAKKALGAESLRVYCNDELLNCVAIPIARQDISDAEGFEVEIPGYVWALEGVTDQCALTISAGDGDSKPISFTHADVIKWAFEAVNMPAGPRRLYRLLSLLEHLRYSGLLRRLEKDVQEKVVEFAREMQLEKFLTESEGEPEEELLKQPEESAGTLILWKALRTLNARLIQHGGSPLQHIKAVMQTLRGTKETRDHFARSCVPLLCRSNELLQARDLIDLADLQSLEAREELWALSMAAVAFAADGRLGRAADLLFKMSKSITKGWLNTECIQFAVSHAIRLETEGEGTYQDLEKIRYGFVGILDSFKGDWFSRLHDQHLVDTMLDIVTHADRYTDYHRKDMLRAAIRHYGLIPAFWSGWQQRAAHVSDPEMELAHRQWMTLAAALENTSLDSADKLETLLAGVRFFWGYQNPDALVLLRETVIQALPILNRSMTLAGRQLIEELLNNDWREMLRIAAAALDTDNAVVAGVPQIEVRLLNVLREMIWRDRSLFYGVQMEASDCLDRCRQTKAQDAESLQGLLATLESRAVGLANGPGGYLAADVLASGYALALEASVDGEHLLMRLEGIIRRCIQEVKADGYLPPAVQAALYRLQCLPADPILAAFLHEVGIQASEKFGPSCFPKTPRNSVLPMPQGGWPSDTLVAIYSCRKYLDTRVKAIRETWVEDLKQRGIPYVVVVGDGDDSVTGDVLALNVSDRYEDLPKKSLKLFEWVYRNTDAQYVLKIDDDCYLDVARYFDSLSYRKHLYYGRVIRREIGGTDRVWHQGKSFSLRGQKSIDKSPDPSLYADGGGAYCLSRMAMEKLLDAAQRPDGRRLVACSFMEDKLVGDLLAMSSIVPSNEDYESYQRRRTFAEATPVGMYDNSFFAGPLSPTKVIHLDTEHDQALAHARSRIKELWPKKIWPTCWLPSIATNSNQLELLSDASVAVRALEASVIVVAVVRNEMTMLPHFLAHYRKLGVRTFAMVDNCSDDGSREYLREQPDVVLYSADTEYKSSHFGVAWQQAVLGNLCLGKWVIVADADELLVYEGSETTSIDRFIGKLESQGATGVRVDMIDMYPFGDLEAADFDSQGPFEAAPWFDRKAVAPWLLTGGFYGNSTTVVSNLRHRLINVAAPNAFTSQKYALFRYQPWVRLSQGLHDAAGLRIASEPAWFAHFKYHAGFAEKVKTEIRRGQHFKGAEEYKRYAAMLREGKGGFGNDGLSVRYEGSASFSQLAPHVASGANR